MKKLVRLPHFTTFLLRRFSTTTSASLRSLLSSPNPAHQTQALSLLSLQPRLLSPVSAQLLIKFAKTGSLSLPANISQLTINLSRHVGPTKALEFLRAVKNNHGGVGFETRVFNSVLNGFAREKDYESMNELVSEMKQMGVKADVFTYGIIMNYLCKSGQIDDALKLVDEMLKRDSEVKPDLIMFNVVINGLCKVCRVKEGLILLKKMNKLGFKPDSVTFNTLIDGFCKNGDLEAGFELINKMEEFNISPNVITLNLIISGLCRNGKLGTAFDFFKNKKVEWAEIKCDEITYSTLIGAFLHSNNVQKAMDLFEEMLKNSLKPDKITYFTIISGLAQAGLVNKAFFITSNMKKDGFKLDLKSYNILLNGFCNIKRLDKACELLDEMNENGIKPDLFTYNTLLSAFCKIGDFSSVSEILRKMKENNIKPSIVTYGTIINGYCKANNISEALNIFRKMRNPNTIIYNTLIEALCKNKDVKMAVCLVNEMKEKGVNANVTTFNAVLKGLKEESGNEKSDFEETGFEILDLMVKEKCKPNFVTIDLLLNWLPKIGEEIRFKKFIAAFKDSGLDL